MTDPIEEAKNKLGAAARRHLGEKAVEGAVQRAVEAVTLSADDKARREQERATKGKKDLLLWILAGTAVVVLGLGVMAMLARLWMWAIGIVVLGGIGAAGYLVIKPKLSALKQKATARLMETRERERAEKEVQRQIAVQAAQQEKLEDDLAALKKKI